MVAIILMFDYTAARLSSFFTVTGSLPLYIKLKNLEFRRPLVHVPGTGLTLAFACHIQSGVPINLSIGLVNCCLLVVKGTSSYGCGIPLWWRNRQPNVRCLCCLFGLRQDPRRIDPSLERYFPSPGTFRSLVFKSHPFHSCLTLCVPSQTPFLSSSFLPA